MALAIGARLEEFESSQQSLDLYCDVLKMWRTDTKVNASLETLGAWFEPSLSTQALEYTVKLKTRIGKCLCDMGEMEKGALGYRDAYLVSLFFVVEPNGITMDDKYSLCDDSISPTLPLSNHFPPPKTY